MNTFKTIFSIDLRSIALFRISLALLILVDLAWRIGDLSVFYTNSGILPLRYWPDVTHRWHLSLHAASGEWWWQLALFALAALFALLLLLGYRCRLMAALSLLLLMSLMNRNGLVLQGGDQLLVAMNFWALFLPLGARWSVDAALQPERRRNPNVLRHVDTEPQRWFSVASVAVILQVLYLYFFTALLKTGAAWRTRFDAAFYAVSLQQFATPIAAFMREFPLLLKLSTIYVLLVEFLGPVLALIPRTRWIALLLLASLHVAFLLMLHIGLFPFIDFMSLALLIPSAWWCWLANRRVNSQRWAERSGIVIHYDEDCGFCLKMCLILREFLLPDSVQIVQAQADPDIYAIMERENSWVVTDTHGQHYLHWDAMQFLFSQSTLFRPLAWIMSWRPFMKLGHRIYRWVAENRGLMGDVTMRWLPYRPLRLQSGVVAQCLAAYFLYVVTMFNLAGLPDLKQWLPLPTHVDYSARLARLDQRWDMFAPFPLTVSMYPVVEGELRDGSAVNLYPRTSSLSTWPVPEDMYSLYDGYRWRKYLGRVEGHANHTVRQGFGDYHCRRWNTDDTARAKQLARFSVSFRYLKTNTEGLPKESTFNTVWQHWCYAEFAPPEHSG